MELDEARKIVSACVDTRYSLMSMPGYDEYRPLPKVSLEEMLVANRLVSEAGSTPNPNGSGTILHMVVAPRGLAAMYTRERYQHNPEDCLEAMGWQLVSPLRDEEEE